MCQIYFDNILTFSPWIYFKALVLAIKGGKINEKMFCINHYFSIIAAVAMFLAQEE